MIIQYKKSSDPDFMFQTTYSIEEELANKHKNSPSQIFLSKNTYFHTPKTTLPTQFSKILSIEAGITYEFIEHNRKGIFWTLENQKGDTLYKRILKDKKPFRLLISSQYAGRLPVILKAADKNGNNVIFFIYATYKRLVRSSSWTKKGDKTPIKNLQPGAVFQQPIHLSMVTWGLNGYDVKISVKEVRTEENFPEVASYYTRVENGEINLPINDAESWLGPDFWFLKSSWNKTINCYFVQVYPVGEHSPIPDKNHRVIHADYLYLTDDNIYLNTPDDLGGISAVVGRVPNKYGVQNKNPDLFYYEGTKSWGKLQKDAADVKAILDARKDEFMAKAGSAGVDAISCLEKLSEEQVQKLYEGNDYTGGFFGTRDVLKKETANTIVRNFYCGNGKKVSFGPNTDIAKRLYQYKPFQDYFKNNYLQMIKYVLEDPDFDIRTIEEEEIKRIFGPDNLKKLALPNFTGVNYRPKEAAADLYVRAYNEKGFEYYGLMGGTQTVKVDLVIEETQPGLFKVDTTMYIGDWYCSDWGDLNSGKNYMEIYGKLMDQFTDVGKALVAQNMATAAMVNRLNDMMGHKKGSMPCLNAFFWLQYHYGYLPGYEKNYKPFETELVYKSVNFLSINKK